MGSAPKGGILLQPCPTLGLIWLLWSHHSTIAQLQSLAVKSGSTPVGGPVKSGWKRTKEKGRGLDKGMVRPELRPIGFNDKGVER